MSSHQLKTQTRHRIDERRSGNGSLRRKTIKNDKDVDSNRGREGTTVSYYAVLGFSSRLTIGLCIEW